MSDTNPMSGFNRLRMHRRKFVGASLATAAGALLAACGGDPDSGESTTDTSSGSTSTTGSGSASTPKVEPTSTTQVGIGDSGDEKPVPGGRLVIADAQGDAPLDPFKTTWHSTAHFLVYTSYVDTDLDLSYIPYTFASWEASADGKDVTFKVAPDITFSDGTPVNAEAIKFNIDTSTDPERHSPGASAYGPIKDVEVVDDMTVTLKYDVPYAPLLNGLSGREVASKTAFEKWGDDFTNHPVGAGPYLVKQQVPGNEILYTRNPDYKWPPKFYKNRGPAYPDEISLKIIKEDATIWAALQSGDVHIGAIPSTFVKDAEGNDNVTVVKQLDTGIRYLGMNCSKPPFDDPLVRQAIAHAIDRKPIVDNALDGYGEVLYTPLAVNIAYSDNEAMQKISYPYDVAAGKDKLKQAGYDVSGEYATKDGKPFEVQLMVNNTDFFKRAAQIVQAQLKELGIKINIQIMEGTALNDATTTGNHQMFLQLYGSTDPNIMFYFFHSSRKKATNRAWYSTPELDSLLEQGQQSVDPEKQKEIYLKVQETVVKEAPWVVLCNPYEFTGVRKEVRGFTVHPQGGLLLHDAWLKQ